MTDDSVTDVIQVKSNNRKKCKICNFLSDDFEGEINHIIKEHEYILKFFGTESISNDNQEPFHHTVAMLVK